MKQLPIFLAIACACSILFSCKTTTLLNATFEADAVGAHPATNLPGEPTGDVIQYAAPLATQLIIGNSLVPSSGTTKALYFTNAPTTADALSLWASFKGTATDLTNPIWVYYNAKNTGAIVPVMIDITDGSVNLIARMRIDANGDISLARNITDIYTDLIGNIGTLGHTIFFTLNFASLRYNVTVLKEQGASITALDKLMITQNALQFANPAHPSISYSYQNASRNVNQKYIIEDIHITKKIPDMIK